MGLLLPGCTKLILPAAVVALSREVYAQPLTAADFSCFVNAYVAGDSYANCDGVGGLTPNDFMCFQRRYNAGDPWANCDGSGTPPSNEGWTNLTPPAGALVFYVAANGSDSNPGTQAAPFRTLARGYSACRDGHPDQVLLRCGDTFTGSLDLNKGSNSTAAYLVIGSYGATAANPRAKIRTTDSAFNFQGVRGLALVGLDIQPSSGHPMNMAWIPDGNGDILFEDCYSAGFVVIISSHAVSGGFIPNLKIRRCVLVDAWAASAQQGHSIFAGDQQGFLAEENVLDRAGRDGPGSPTIFLHSLYIHDANGAGPATVIGNIHARACADSVQVRPGGHVKNNLGLQNPIGIVWGGNGTFSWNVAIDARDVSGEHGRGVAYNLNGNGLVEYNMAGYQVNGTDGVTALAMNGFSGTVRNNYVWDWKGPAGVGWATAVQWDGGSGPVSFTGNTMIMPNLGILIRHESRPLSSQFTYSANTYYTSTPAGGIGGYFQFAAASGKGRDWNAWRSAAGEAGSTFLGSAPANPGFSVAAYLQSLGINPGTDPIDTFMAEARKQSRATWRPAFTAAAFNSWARTKVGLPGNPL